MLQTFFVIKPIWDEGRLTVRMCKRSVFPTVHSECIKLSVERKTMITFFHVIQSTLGLSYPKSSHIWLYNAIQGFSCFKSHKIFAFFRNQLANLQLNVQKWPRSLNAILLNILIYIASLASQLQHFRWYAPICSETYLKTWNQGDMKTRWHEIKATWN